MLPYLQIRSSVGSCALLTKSENFYSPVNRAGPLLRLNPATAHTRDLEPIRASHIGRIHAAMRQIPNRAPDPLLSGDVDNALASPHIEQQRLRPHKDSPLRPQWTQRCADIQARARQGLRLAPGADRENRERVAVGPNPVAAVDFRCAAQ